MIQGFLSISKVLGTNGKYLSSDEAKLLIQAQCKAPEDWNIDETEIPLGENLFVDNGRQILAYLFGNQTPTGSYVCSRFGIGTGSNPTTVSFTDLQSPVAFYNSGGSTLAYTKPIDGIDFPAPYQARVQFTLATTEANGLLVSEFGLYCQDINTQITTLLCRKTATAVMKNSSSALTFLWRLRF